MSDQPITLEFLSRQIVGLRDEVRSLADQMGVLTAIVLRLDRDGARRDERDTDMLNEMRARWCASINASTSDCGRLKSGDGLNRI